MSKSRIVDEQGTPKALLPSKSDTGYPAKKGKNPKPQEKPTHRSTLSFSGADFEVEGNTFIPKGFEKA